MLAIDNDSLGELCSKGDLVEWLGHIGRIEYGTIDGEESNLLGFITTCENKNYLVSVKGRLLKGVKKL